MKTIEFEPLANKIMEIDYEILLFSPATLRILIFSRKKVAQFFT